MKLAPLDKTRLSDFVLLWNRHIGDAFPMTETLFNQNSFDDDNVCMDASRMVINEDDQLVGFVVAKRWQETIDVSMSKTTGWIQVLLIDEAARNQGNGSRLLAHVESTFASKGITKLLLGRDPYHYFPGIPTEFAHVASWFESKGYTHSDTEYDLLRSYTDDDSDVERSKHIPEKSNVHFTLLDISEQDDLLAFLHRCFPGRWEYEAMHYFRKGGTGREFAVLKKNDQIIGFCRINDSKSPYIAQNVYWSPLFDDELGGVGPLGVDAQERGQGYGIAMVETGIAYLRQRGINRIAIDWTGLVDFYKKLSYTPWKSYESYNKTL